MEYSKRKTDATVTTRIGTEVEYADPYGRVAVGQLEGHQTIGVNGKYVPFHAVDAVVVEEEIIKVEKPNPYFCEAEEGGGGSRGIACEGKVCEAKTEC